VAGIQYHDDVYGASATLNVWEPKLNKDSKDFIATWVQINNGIFLFGKNINDII
jgi:hypothetical protein